MPTYDDAQLLDLILRAMRVCRNFGYPACSQLWWRTDVSYAPVTLFIRCDDLFAWATADDERVTQENIHVLEQAVVDIQTVTPDDLSLADLLFCCRVRGLRPQRPYYDFIPEALRPLFDACGPARED